MSHGFKVGDVVRLKSGGPKMTITAIDEYRQAWVSWFNDELKPQAQAFPQEALESAQ